MSNFGHFLDNYCGHQFWDTNLTWNTTKPILTPCLLSTALIWTPSILLWIFGIMSLFYHWFSSKSTVKVQWNWLIATKMILIFVLFIVNIIDLVHQLVSLINGLDNVYPIYYLTPLIKAASYLFTLIVQWVHLRKGVNTSGILSLYWLIMSFQSLLSLWTTIVTLQNPYDKFWTITRFSLTCQSIETGATILTLIAICFADKRREKSTEESKKICPYIVASFASQMTFSWYDSMAYLGFKKPLTLDDMWLLPKPNRSRNVFIKFRKYLNASKHCVRPTINTDNQLSLKSSMGSSKLLPDSYSIWYNPKFNILITLIKGFWFHLAACSILKLISSFLTFSNPSLLDKLLTFVKSSDPSWQGYLIAVGMFTFSLLQSLIDGQYEFWISNLGLRMKSAMVSTIYQKSLKLSSQGRKAFTTGEIVNLMGVDTNRVFMFINQYNFLLSFPIQLGMSLSLLWNQLGVSSVGGLVFMILLIPFNGWVAMKMKNIQQNVMKQKDKRTKTMNEILSGMKVLKLYAWELAFGELIKDARALEIKALKTQAIFSACTSFLFFSAPFFVALISFATFVLSDPSHVLDANKAFVSLSLFNILSQSLTMLPRVITTGANCWVSIKRIDKYLRAEEIDLSQITHHSDPNAPIKIESATFTWSSTDSPVLCDIDCSIKKGSLVAIVGPIGSGKSSLLSALLGDVFRVSGSVNLKGSLAYVPQTSWIQNETLKRNIVFGQPYVQTKYNQVIDACALVQDLKILPGGDETEIGERGINLSGGQKQRVSLARSVYADADIYLLDDPLSAVDAHVAKHLFKNVIGPKGLLSDKTRLLVTHRITFLPQVDEIIVLKGGAIHEKGTYSQLIEKKGEFAEFVVQYLTECQLEGENIDEDHEELEKIIESVKPELEKRLSMAVSETSETDLKTKQERHRTLTSSISRQSLTSNGQLGDAKTKLPRDKDLSNNKNEKSVENKTVALNGGRDRSKLIDKEKAATGSVKTRVYFDYFKAVGYGMCILVVASFATSNLLTIGRNLWLTAWADDSLDSMNLNDTNLRNLRLGIYAGIGGAETVFTMTNSLLLNIAVLTGSKLIHDRMLDRIIRAPMSFYDTTPLGRILNRFSGDIDTCDSTIGFNLRMLISLSFRGIISIIVICLETPYFLVVIICMMAIYSLIQMFYIASSRQLRRIESSSRSPIFSHFSETVTGSSTIRAYNADQRFIEECYNRVDINQSCSFANMAAGRWLSARLQFLGNLIVFTSAIFAVSSRSRLSPGLTGLFVSYASQITGILNMLVRSVTDIETNIVAVERCFEYTKTPLEAPIVIDSDRPKPTWPDKGEVIFKNYVTRYRDDLDPVLHEISLTIKPNEKIGIVGRTGAGKSSLTLAIFRIIEAVAGQVIIDEMDISKLGLHDLRSRLTVIPQDPVLFSGNFRRNFDPLNKHTDDEIWRALGQAHLKNFVSSLEKGLDYEIAEGGENLSVGQRQLVCLTRALLRKTKILVLDEATAAVDVETDELIQKTIRSEFADCTIITIAHRLNTIMDYDRILVLDQGEMKEFDSPNNLLANDQSMFYSMAKESKLIN